jgi:Rieske Fe-S protein
MSQPTRRELLATAAALAAAACAPAGDDGTGDSLDTDSDGDTEPGGPEWCEPVAGTQAEGWTPLLLADYSQLEVVGGHVTVTIGGERINVVHVEQDCYVAMGTVCTHEGCTVEVRSGARFVCPCHGALYNWSGVPIAGPAFDPLPTFPAAARDGAVWVKVS